jgi:hypothetical protein
VRAARRRTGVRVRAHQEIVILPGFSWSFPGEPLATPTDMIWFFERNSSLIVCEIRRAVDDDAKFEFEIADAQGPTTHRFESPTELIANYLAEQGRLLAQGWRPRNASALE